MVVRAASSYLDRTVTGRYFGTGNGSRLVWNLACGTTWRALIHPVLYKQDWMGGARTNNFVQSQTLNTTWTKTSCTISSDATTAPDGTLTADKVQEANATAAHFIRQNIAVSAIDYAISFYAKAGERSIVWATFDGGSNTTYFNLATGAVGTKNHTRATIQSVGDGWYRCTISNTLVAGTANCFIGPTTTDGVISYAGDTSGTFGAYVWGAQMEAGTYSTAYIPTTSAAVTVYDVGFTQLYSTARTNLCLQSQTFQTTWSLSGLKAFGAGSTINAAAAPDGTLTADFVCEDTALATHNIYQGSIPVTSGSVYTWSMFVKAAGRTHVSLVPQATAPLSSPSFNLSTGTVIALNGATTATITPMGDGWFRLTATNTATATGNGYHQFNLLDNSNGSTYTGDGASGAYLWGAQIDAGAVATPYIPTTTAAVTVTDYSTDSAGKVTFASAPAAGTQLTYKDPWATNVYRHFGLGDGTNVDFSLPFAPATPLIYRRSWAGNELLYATARTNLFLQSQTFQTTWVLQFCRAFGSGSTVNNDTAPDGTVTADTIIEDNTTNIHTIYQVFTSVSGTTYTASIYVKAAGRTKVDLRVDATANICAYRFDLVAKTATLSTGSGSGSITDLGSGWFRLTLTVAATASGTGYVTLYLVNAAGSGSYAGDNTSGVTLWGGQLEVGSIATPYIPTTVAAVTVTDYALDMAGRGDVTFASAPVDLATLSATMSMGPKP